VRSQDWYRLACEVTIVTKLTIERPFSERSVVESRTKGGAHAGRTAVITGGTGALGEAIAARLRANGARVARWDLRETPGDDLVLSVDVTDEQAVANAVRMTVNALGPIDILVNNAGIQGPVADMLDLALADWRRILDVNLTGTFICSQAIVPMMCERRWGRVVNVASLRGKEGPPKTSAYNASKAGMIALTKTMGKELAGTGVLVNCVTPTVVEGGLSDAASPDELAALRALIPMKRFCRADEVAAMVTFLASDDSSFSTGAVFDLSGGRATY
jgi:2-dehydro-3-deoxy-L-rhamnonate dehydrogenase (NAD+)